MYPKKKIYYIAQYNYSFYYKIYNDGFFKNKKII